MADGIPKEDLERMLFFDEARKQAQADLKKDPKNAAAFTRLGGALLELAHFRSGNEAYEMIEQAVSKFQSALKINEKKHDALWCLGNAYTSQGFLNTDSGKAQEFFLMAAECFKKAVAEDPNNEVYKKALDMSAKAPQLHAELQKQLHAQQAIQQSQGQPGSGKGAASSKSAGGDSDVWYDVGGWVILAGVIFGMLAMAAPPPQPAQ
mmetsp:Transcript_7499/g.21215  ORF Transcript_7499/g.21215 Transcript_7499/m.21215 type:complete len:207 (+) Transcript_7499:222-842(+)|eukprot:CAMPEP_0117668226 /NCGR_PEP_ID=MMETSP0804-20121206/11427_1 /TAXON_ID=1074897 /ORGANISM="Tetraselmis astigmatica, Strain CCMP880" /LENGTH=206 /DNA_ID=CAMNT_0005476085 /DNA_START=195 /DNA_END=815 /DNA_ORIENTATION=+